MRMRSTYLALAAAALVAAGCGSDSTAPSSTRFVGRYGLVSVDGSALPLIVFDTPALRLTVTSGALTLNANNTFAEEIRLDVEANGFPEAPELPVCTGTYQRNGNTFSLNSTPTGECSGGAATATLDGNTLTLSEDGSTLVFRR